MLCNLLGLKPLDRVQLNDAREIREMSLAPQLGYEAELPFLYFQRPLEDGCLEVRSPSGYVTKVAPADICDFVAGDPIVVRAMPKSVFMERLKLSTSEPRPRPGPEGFADAYVLYVSRDRWGRIDQVHVWFLDPKHNSDKPWPAPLEDGERANLERLARRTRMPVLSRTGGYRSADHGIAKQEAFTSDLVRHFINCAVCGDRQGVEMLAMAGAKAVTRKGLRKLVLSNANAGQSLTKR